MVEWPGGRIWTKHNFRLMACIGQCLFDRINSSYSLHCTQVDCCAIIYLLCRQHRAAHDVVYLGPVARLRAISPHLEGGLANGRLGVHINNSMVLYCLRPVDGEVTARGCLQAVFLVLPLERQLGLQLGPAVHIVGIVGRFDQILCEVDFFFRVTLQRVGVYAA